MKIVIGIVACLYTVTGFGQTKLISFRSHSGSNANFRLAVEKDLFDISNSNFGIIEIERIDSVIMKSNDRIVVFRMRSYGNTRRFRDTLTRSNAGGIFAATSLQSLKAAVQKKYRKADIYNAQFVGFDNKFKRSKK